MSTLTSPIKLNQTTITARSSPPTSYALKLGLIPHLLIQDPLISCSRYRKDTDGIFEVTIPVGGMVELEIEVDREGLGRVGGMEMSIIQEIELEEMIKQSIVSTFQQNTAQLAIEEIRPHGNKTSFIIRPLASSADRSSANTALVSTYQPVAHLSKIELCLNCCPPTSREKESDESQSSNTDSLPSNYGTEDLLQMEELGVGGTNTVGQLPKWANNQLHQALDQLFRTNLIRRFPLIFDPDLPRVIPSITKSHTLLHTLTRALALSASHGTNLYVAARPLLKSLLKEQDRMSKYKIEQISNLSRRGKSFKRIKGDIAEEESQPSPVESQAIATQEAPREINVKLLSDAISRVGFSDYKSRRARGGKLGYRSIKLSFGDTDETSRPSDSTASQELRTKMQQLHLDDEQRFGEFLETDVDDDIDEQQIAGRYNDDLFPHSDDDDDRFLESEDHDGFLDSDQDDDFLDTDEEDGDGSMDGGDVLGYPWPGQTEEGSDEWLDEVGVRVGDHHQLDEDDALLDFDHHSRSPCRREDLGPGDYPEYRSEQEETEEDDDFLDSDNEDQPPGRAHPLLDSTPYHFPLMPEHMPMALDDDFLDDDDIGDHENQTSARVEVPPSVSHLLPSTLSDRSMPIYSTPYIRSRSPQMSLGQAGAMIQIQEPVHYDDDFLDSDQEVESEMGIYTTDQYLPVPEMGDLNVDRHSHDPGFESEMGVYTADQDFLDSDSEDGLDTEMGELTFDQHLNPNITCAPNQYPHEPESGFESEMGVYTADQVFDPPQTSHSLNSDQSMSPRNDFWDDDDDDDDEEVVFRIPNGPPIDMRHYQYPIDDLEDDFLMSDNEAMSIHSRSPITPSARNEGGDQYGFDGDVQHMVLGRLIDHDKSHSMDMNSSDVLPFPPDNTYMLDEAMPPSQECIESDDDLF